MSTVFAPGRAANCAGSGFSSFSSKSKGMVFGFGADGREVAAYETWRYTQRGMRNVDVQPAPKMSKSTCLPLAVSMAVVNGRDTCERRRRGSENQAISA